tara:strand:+ start:176 stop:463 length:288 start_codon:yes stop_codon:yes gene_type:complete
MNFSPVLGYIRTTKKEKYFIQKQEITITELKNQNQQLKDKIKLLSLQSTNHQNQNTIDKTTISLLKDLIKKQSIEIRKIKKNNIYQFDKNNYLIS